MKTTVKLWTVASNPGWAEFHALDKASPARFATPEEAQKAIADDGFAPKGYKIYPVTLTIEVGEAGQPAKKGEE